MQKTHASRRPPLNGRSVKRGPTSAVFMLLFMLMLTLTPCGMQPMRPAPLLLWLLRRTTITRRRTETAVAVACDLLLKKRRLRKSRTTFNCESKRRHPVDVWWRCGLE